MIVTWKCNRHYGVTPITYTGEVVDERGDLLVVFITKYKVNGREHKAGGVMTVLKEEVKEITSEQSASPNLRQV